MNNADPLKRKRTLTLLLTLTLCAALAGGIYAYSRSRPSSQPADAASEVQTATVRQGDLVIYASGSGALTANAQASFGFLTSGQVTKINVSVGDKVEAGQVIAELEGDSAQAAYQQAERALAELTSSAALATAQAAVAEAEYNVFTAREDLQYLVSPAVQIWQERLQDDEKLLAAAQAEAQSNPSAEAMQKIQDAQDAVDLDKFYLEEAQGNYYTYLKENFSVMSFNPRNDTEKPVYYIDENGVKYTDIYPPTKTEIAVAQTAYDLARATLEEAKNYLAAITGGEIPEGYVSSKLVMLEKVKDNLTIAEQNLKNTQLTAPIAGTVMSLDLNVGDSVNVGATPVTIADLSQPTLEIYLDESDWGNIDPDYEVEVTFDILPDTVFHGRVIQVDPGLYSSESVLAVRATVQLEDVTADFDLPLGSSASVDVIGGRAENAVLIPIEALHKAGEKYAVFVMENGELRLRIVEVGIQNLQYAEIVSGLEPGDVVSTGLTVTK